MDMLTYLKILISDSFYQSPNSLQFDTLRNVIELPLIALHLATQAKEKKGLKLAQNVRERGRSSMALLEGH